MKRRIVVSIVGVALVALLLLGIPLAVAVEQFYAKEQVLYLDREASEATQRVDAGTISSGRRVEIHDEGGTRLAVYDSSGRKMSGTGPEWADPPVEHALEGNPDDARIGGDTVVAITLYDAGRVVGAMRASEARQVVVNRTLRTWLIMAVLAIAALVVVVLLARRQARRLTRPIDELVLAANRLGGGDFSVRTERSGVPELDEVGDALDTTADRLGNLVARERAFSSDASHQLRTPLAGLRIQVESALLTPGRDPRVALEATLEPIDRLDATVSSLLELARDAHPRRDPLDAADLVADVNGEWEARLVGAGRGVLVAIDDDLPSPPVAEPAIRQILHVLLENAFVHGAGTVTISVRRVTGALAIDVADEGPGLREGAPAFTRRADRSGGIGLPLARSLAEAEGARLVLERAGPGPVFRLIIPVDDQ